MICKNRENFCTVLKRNFNKCLDLNHEIYKNLLCKKQLQFFKECRCKKISRYCRKSSKVEDILQQKKCSHLIMLSTNKN